MRIFFIFSLLIASQVALGQERNGYILDPLRMFARLIPQTSDTWGFNLDITQKEIQCANSPITVMMTIEEAVHLISNFGVSVNSKAVKVEKSYFGSNLIAEIVLEPAESRGDKCNPETSATLTVTMTCNLCREILATFRVFSGVARASIESSKLAVVDVTESASDAIRTLRCFTEIDKRLLIGNRVVIATIEFRPKETEKITNFVARPRTLIKRQQNWYTEKRDPMGATLVLELHLPTNESKVPVLVIDVECQGCDPDSVILKYGPQYRSREYTTIARAEQVLSSVVRREERQPSHDGPCGRYSHCYGTSLKIDDYCDDTLKTWLQVVTAEKRKMKFWWMYNQKKYDALVYKLDDRQLVTWAPATAVNPCSQWKKDVDSGLMSASQIDLKIGLMSASQIDFKVFLYVVDPRWERGSVLAQTADLKGNWQGPDICKITVAGETKQRPNVEVSSLYYTVVLSPARTMAPNNRLGVMNEADDHRVFKMWEQKIAKTPSLNEWQFKGGSEKLCTNLKGSRRAYYRIDALREATMNIKKEAERHLNPAEDEDLAVKILPKLEEFGGVDRWLLSTALIETSREVLCKGLALRYNISQLPSQKMGKSRVTAPEDWTVFSKEESSDGLVVIVTTKSRCSAAPQVLLMELLCDRPCPAPVVSVTVENTPTTTSTTLNMSSGKKSAAATTPAPGSGTGVQPFPPGLALLTSVAPRTVTDNRAEFIILDSKKRAEVVSPFVVIFCLQAQQAESIQSVSVGFLKLSPIQSFMHEKGVGRCFAFDSFATLSIALAEPLTVVVSGDMPPPTKLNYSLDYAMKFDTIPKIMQYTSEKHGGWYGPIEERLKYSFSGDVSEVRIRMEPGHGFVLATDSSSASGVRGSRKDDSSAEFLVFLRPAFRLTTSTKIEYKSGALLSFRINTLVSAFALAAVIFPHRRQ